MTASSDVAAWLDQYVTDREAAAAEAAAAPLREQIAGLLTEVADRDATIAALQPPLSVTRFGVSVPGPVALTDARSLGYSTFRRFYSSTLPATWTSDAVLAGAAAGDVWVLSHKTSTDAQVSAFLATVPDGVDVWMCRHHEPENDGVDKSAYRAAQASHAKAVQAAGFKACLILMGYTSEPGSGRDYRDWYAPEVDVIFWDAYNSGNKKTPPIFETPEHILEGILTVAVQTGKPWGVTETGAKVECVASNGFADRPAWAAAYAKALRDNGALVALWWDQVNAGGTFDVRLDAATAAAWH